MDESGKGIDKIVNMVDGESVILIINVDEIWDNDITWIAQKGTLSDNTGKACFRVFSHSNLPKFELGKTYRINNAIAHIWDGWSSIDLDEHTDITELYPINIFDNVKSVYSSIDNILLTIGANNGFYYIIGGYAKDVIINDDHENAYSDNIFLIIKPSGYIAITRTSDRKYNSISKVDRLSFYKIKDGYYFIANSKDDDSVFIIFKEINCVQYRFEPNFPQLNYNISKDEYYNKIKQLYPNAKKRWTTEEVEELIKDYKANNDYFSIADRFQKEPSAIIAKLILLNLTKDAISTGSNQINTSLLDKQIRNVMKPYTREIVILANSIKYSGRCIAGKDIKTGEWVRVVPDNEEKAFTSSELYNLYKNQNGPKLLDIVVITFSHKVSLNYHPEDEYIEPDKRWAKTGLFNIKDDMDKIVDVEDWVSKTSKIFNKTDKIPASYFKKPRLINSLQLIKLDAQINQPILKYQHKPDKGYFRPRLCFDYYSAKYDLAITDPNWHIMNIDLGPKALGNCYITVGLSELFEDKYHYKLIVGMIVQD